MQDLRPSVGRLTELVRRELAAFAVRRAEPHEAATVRDFAASLIGEGIVTAEDLGRVHEMSGGATLFVTEENGALTGVLAFVLLTRAGWKAVEAELFDALSPAKAHVAGPADPAWTFYGWGVAATTKASARRVVEGARAVMAGPAGYLPKYARPTTDAGRRLMGERLGFEPLPGSASGLVWQAPRRLEAAA